MVFHTSTTKLFKTMAFLTLAVLLSLIIYLPASAFTRFDENEVKAAFLYNLTNFVYWPKESFSDSSSPFKIVILGKDPFGSVLENLVRNEQVDSHPIEIEAIENIDNVNFAHLLFISSEQNDNIETIISKSNQLGMLTVSDYSGFNDAGGGITLLKIKNRLQLYLSIDVIEQNGLRCSSKLLQLATIVKGVRR